MDENDLAWKIAAATLKSLNAPNASALDDVLVELKPSARDIARAYALCLTTAPFSQYEANRLILNTRLQVALVHEHVVAQERMGRTINILTWVLVAMTAVLIALDAWHRV